MKESSSTLTSSQLQEFRGLINSDLDAAFQYLKSKAHDPSKGRRKRRSKYESDC